MSEVKSKRSKVAKFGGTSLADATQVKKVIAIIKADPAIRFVVVSAPGKRHPGDTKVTDLLLGWYQTVLEGGETAVLMAELEARYHNIVSDLILEPGRCKWVKEKLTHLIGGLEISLKHGTASQAYVLSRGEFLMGVLMAELLEWEFTKPQSIIRFDRSGQLPEWRLTADLIHNEFSVAAKNQRFVIPGFYGADLNGREVVTFSRGGSDVTGALIAGALGIPYENWTDTDGLMTADPRMVPQARRVEHLTFAEAGEAAYLGMGALHSLTLYPVAQGGGEMWVKNTNNPSYPGTWILSAIPEESEHPVRLITGRGGFSIVTITKPLMNESLGMIAAVSAHFTKTGISIEHMPGGVDSLSVVVDCKKTSVEVLERCAKEIATALLAEVEVEHDLALLCIIGQDMRRHVGSAARAIDAVANAGINIRLINQGASEVNITIGVQASDLSNAIKAVHATFFAEPMKATYIG